MASIEIIAMREVDGKEVWVRLPTKDPETNRPTKAPKGARYRARWRTPDGASRVRTFERKFDAEQCLVQAEHSKATGVYVDRSAGDVTVRAYAETWIATPSDKGRQTAWGSNAGAVRAALPHPHRARARIREAARPTPRPSPGVACQPQRVDGAGEGVSTASGDDDDRR